MLIFWSLVRNSVVLAVHPLFSVACFFTVHEHILGSSILLHETYLEKFAEQIEDDLCIAPANIHEVFIYPFSHVQPSKVIELVQNLNQTAVDQHETLSNSAYIYRHSDLMQKVGLFFVQYSLAS